MNRALLHAAWHLIRGDRPIGFFLLLWPVLWSLWLAGNGLPATKLLIIFIAGVFLTRAAGCVINDYADRKFDAQVQRTRDRPLASGAITVPLAIGLGIILSATAFALVLLTNRLTICLAMVAALLMLIYPFSKRWLPLPQLLLGIAFAWGVPMAFSASSGGIPPSAWLLFIAVLSWVVCYDTFYAMADREEDRQIGIHSAALLFGQKDRIISAILQGITLSLLAFCGLRFGLGYPYFVSLGITALLFGWQQYLIRQREPAACLQAFRNNGWVGGIIFLGIVFSLPS